MQMTNQTLLKLWFLSLTFSQTTNFGRFQIERVCRRQFKIWWKWQKLQEGWKHCGKKEKLLVTSNFSFSHSVFKRLVLQTCKNQGLFGKGLIEQKTLWVKEKMWVSSIFSFSHNVFKRCLPQELLKVRMVQ